MKYIIGEKVSMTQVFTEDGRVHAGTIVKIAPTVVTQVKTEATDGYNAVQVASGTRRAKNVAKPQLGHFGDLGVFRHVREFKVSKELVDAAAKGNQITIDAFQVGDIVEVAGISKGKGFQGVVKRHGFHGGPRSHGQKHSEREAGSIGGGGGRAGGRVAKGMRMAGRMGSDRITVKNLKVLTIDPAEGIMIISGAVPGRRNTVLEIVSK